MTWNHGYINPIVTLNNDIILNFLFCVITMDILINNVLILHVSMDTKIILKFNVKKYQLQDLTAIFLVINQIQCLRYQIKAEIIYIQIMKQTLKKIELMQFQMQIELIYKNLATN